MKKNKNTKKKIKNEKKHEDLLNMLDAIREQYSKFRNDNFAVALKNVLNIVVAVSDFSIEQIRDGVAFVDTEVGKLSKCILAYLNEHSVLLNNEMLTAAEQIANSDIDDEE